MTSPTETVFVIMYYEEGINFGEKDSLYAIKGITTTEKDAIRMLLAEVARREGFPSLAKLLISEDPVAIWDDLLKKNPYGGDVGDYIRHYGPPAGKMWNFIESDSLREYYIEEAQLSRPAKASPKKPAKILPKTTSKASVKTSSKMSPKTKTSKMTSKAVSKDLSKREKLVKSMRTGLDWKNFRKIYRETVGESLTAKEYSKAWSVYKTINTK